MAALQKVRRLPWEKEENKEQPKEAAAATNGTAAVDAAENEQDPKRPRIDESAEAVVTVAQADAVVEDKRASAPWGPQRKKNRLHGYKEDPYVFFKPDEDVWKVISSFYELDAKFNPLCLLTRSFSDKKKNIYYCSEPVRDLLLCNQDTIKIINTGVKTFVRCDNRNMKCSYRFVQLH